LLLSSRVVLAEEAERLGLLARVVAPDALEGAIREYAGALATGIAPSSLAATKRQLYLDQHRGVVESIADADALLRTMMASAEFAEGVAALRERRPPSF
jgi:enoyl-CoA hydratase/carnithine racemase